MLVEPETQATVQPLLDRFGVSMMTGCLAEKPVIELANVVCSRFTPEGRALFHGRHYPFWPTSVGHEWSYGIKGYRNKRFSCGPDDGKCSGFVE